MSLINDALKRAATEKPRDTNPSAPMPPLQPVDPAPAPRNSPVLLAGVLLLGVGAVGIAAALWFNGRAPASTPVAANTAPAQTHHTANTPVPANPPAQNPAPQAAPAHNNTTPQPAAIPLRQSNPQPNLQTIASAPPASGTAPALPASQRVPASTTSTPATPPPATPKPIRLQSIFYRLKSPTVIINGKTLAVGDSVDGAKVVSIQRTSVEIVQNGKYRTLTID